MGEERRVGKKEGRVRNGEIHTEADVQIEERQTSSESQRGAKPTLRTLLSQGRMEGVA